MEKLREGLQGRVSRCRYQRFFHKRGCRGTVESRQGNTAGKVATTATFTHRIQPLLLRLTLIKKSRWGCPFRRGLFEIDRADFRCVAQAMKATWAQPLFRQAVFR